MASTGVSQFLIAFIAGFLIVEYRVPWSAAQVRMIGFCLGHMLIAGMVAVAFSARMTIGRVIGTQQVVGTDAIALGFTGVHGCTSVLD
jgi:hypothetical protein